MKNTVDIQHRWLISEAGKSIAEIMKGHGFVLITTDMNSRDGRMHFVTNLEKPDSLAMLKQFVVDSEKQNKLSGDAEESPLEYPKLSVANCVSEALGTKHDDVQNYLY